MKTNLTALFVLFSTALTACFDPAGSALGDTEMGSTDGADPGTGTDADLDPEPEYGTDGGSTGGDDRPGSTTDFSPYDGSTGATTFFPDDPGGNGPCIGSVVDSWSYAQCVDGFWTQFFWDSWECLDGRVIDVSDEDPTTEPC